MITKLEVQGLRELLTRIPWMSTAEALFLTGLMKKLEGMAPSEPDPPSAPAETEPLRPDPLMGY